MTESVMFPRFIAPFPSLADGARQWRERLRRIEDLGFDEAAISEHYSQGWAMEPLAALAFAAAETSRLRLLTLVLNNDVRNPAVLAKAIATVDVLSEGRVTLGIGAGWLPADYEALGLPFDRPGTRLDRLAEGVTVIRSFFAGGSVDERGKFYKISGLEAIPATIQQSGPPILIGAGGPRMLDLAGGLADIVGVHVTMGANGFDENAAREMSGSAIRAKIDRVRASAAGAGRPVPAIQFTPVVVVIDGIRSTAVRPRFTDYFEENATEFEDSPAVLIGSANTIAESITRWTDELGITLWHLGHNVESVASIVAAARR
ncbi:LLM class flavin-dependent oxidoreductase [Rathayibacter sp. CAU 1779]